MAQPAADTHARAPTRREFPVHCAYSAGSVSVEKPRNAQLFLMEGGKGEGRRTVAAHSLVTSNECILYNNRERERALKNHLIFCLV